MTLDKLIAIINGLSDMAEQVGATPADVQVEIPEDEVPLTHITADWRVSDIRYQIDIYIRTGE